MLLPTVWEQNRPHPYLDSTFLSQVGKADTGAQCLQGRVDYFYFDAYVGFSSSQIILIDSLNLEFVENLEKSILRKSTTQ